MLAFLFGIVKVLAGPATFLFKEVTAWADRRARIQSATLAKDIAKITAEAELAAYKVQSDLNWDLAWAGQASGTWKDEYLLIIWTAPVVVLTICLPLDVFLGTSYVTTLMHLLGTVQGDLIQYWVYGTAIIFSAIFGNKAAGQIMMGSKVSQIAEAFKSLPDEVPPGQVETVTERIRAIANARKRQEEVPKADAK